MMMMMMIYYPGLKIWIVEEVLDNQYRGRYISMSPLSIIYSFPLIFLVFALVFPPGLMGGESVENQLDLLAKPLLEMGYATGIVVGVIEGDKDTIFSYGTVSRDSQEAPDGKTIFEIGSVSKTFTALLLAILAVEGRVNLDDPVRKFLPASVIVPRKWKREITLADLAMHISGLPRMPDNVEPEDPLNPYADYTAEKMYTFLSTYQLPRAPGEIYEYSNLGSGLLGHALARREKKDFEVLVREIICRPLGLKDTSIVLSPVQRSRFAKGYDLEGNPVIHWNFSVLAGCGALRSTARDLLRYTRAQMGTVDSPLSAAINSALIPRHSTDIPGDWQIGLGWHVDKTGSIAWHDGGTYGAYTYIGFNRKRGFGLVWLSNSSLWQVGPLRERLERILLGESIKPLKLRKPVKLDPKVLERYTGEYRIKPGVIMEVTLTEGYLILGVSGKAGGSVLYPESETRFFFLDSEDVTISFVRDEKGRIEKLIFHEEGADTPAEKIK
jgi:serine-type D-Ala-D-Ala carboxypeptidase/endopeptidase